MAGLYDALYILREGSAEGRGVDLLGGGVGMDRFIHSLRQDG